MQDTGFKVPEADVAVLLEAYETVKYVGIMTYFNVGTFLTIGAPSPAINSSFPCIRLSSIKRHKSDSTFLQPRDNEISNH